MTTVVITGASSGVGASAARMLRDSGVRVVIVGRDPNRTAAVAKEFRADAFVADFARLAEVQTLAERLCRKYSRIDVLAANAGGIPPQGKTADGVEATFQTNALAPWLLMELLAEPLAGGRVIATSSQTHARATLPEPVGQIAAHAGGLSRMGVYARAKLAGGILLREFGRRHPDIDVGDFHPGIMATDFVRYMGAPASAAIKVLGKPLLDKPTDGAQRLVHLATANEPLAGHYFVKNRPIAGSPLLQDAELGSQLWQLAENLTAVPHDEP
jgi:NAD(P)-dependent dehydrogenase (short-subunit alcohol dehydrogenase family)